MLLKMRFLKLNFKMGIRSISSPDLFEFGLDSVIIKLI
jgi:hypothetical protein